MENVFNFVSILKNLVLIFLVFYAFYYLYQGNENIKARQSELSQLQGQLQEHQANSDAITMVVNSMCNKLTEQEDAGVKIDDEDLLKFKKDYCVK
jgi:uncharacterized membrane protein affecting hemolysin expression